LGYTNRATVSYEVWQLYLKTNHSALPSSFLVNSRLSYLRTQTGQAVIGFRNKIRLGSDATSPYSTTATKVEYLVNGAATLLWSAKANPSVVYRYEWTGFARAPIDVVHLTSVSTAVQNDALMKIVKKVKAERSHLNGLAFVGELREAIHGLRHPYQTMREQVHAHLTTLNKRKRGIAAGPEPVRRRAWRDIIGSTWLETSFGMKPTVHDVKEIAEALARFQYERPLKSRLQSKSKLLDAKSTSRVFGPGPDKLCYTESKRTESVASCSYSIGTSFTARPAGSVASLTETLGFTLENFVPALHEVMPWSWLIDYFSNLGEMIEAGTLCETGIKWICKSVCVKTTDRYYYALNGQATIQNFDSSNNFLNLSGTHLGRALLSKVDLIRTKPATLGMPDLSFRLPGRDVQHLNLIAILAQFSGKTYDPSWARKVRPPSITRDRIRGVHDASNFLN